MPSYVGNSSAFKQLRGGSGGNGTAIGVSSAWKSLLGMWVGSGGVWKQIFEALAVTLAGTQASHTQSSTNSPTYAGITFESGGDEHSWTATGSSSGTLLGTWLTTGAASDYWVRATLNSGSLDASSKATGTWLAMTSNQFWGVSDDTITATTSDANITIEFATDSGGSNIIATETYDISANRTT